MNDRLIEYLNYYNKNLNDIFENNKVYLLTLKIDDKLGVVRTVEEYNIKYINDESVVFEGERTGVCSLRKIYGEETYMYTSFSKSMVTLVNDLDFHNRLFDKLYKSLRYDIIMNYKATTNKLRDLTDLKNKIDEFDLANREK